MNDGEGSENIEKNSDKKFYWTLFFSTRKTMIIHNPLQLSPFPYQLFYESSYVFTPPDRLDFSCVKFPSPGRHKSANNEVLSPAQERWDPVIDFIV